MVELKIISISAFIFLAIACLSYLMTAICLLFIWKHFSKMVKSLKVTEKKLKEASEIFEKSKELFG